MAVSKTLGYDAGATGRKQGGVNPAWLETAWTRTHFLASSAG
jgi:hypothetical protein